MAEYNGSAQNGAVLEADSAHDGLDSAWGDQDPGDGHQPVRLPVDFQVVTDVGGTRLTNEGHPAFPKPEKPKRHPVRLIVIVVIVAAILGAGWYWGVPWARYELDTVSTDDAFVQSHITYASPRVEAVVTNVLVDQDDRVEPGDLLVTLDREPFEVAAAQARAGLDEAEANVTQSQAQVRSQIAQARGAYYRRKNAQETLRRQIAALKAQFATLKAQQSSRWLAEVDQRRIDHLVKRGSASQSELDQRNNTLKVAAEREKEAWEALQETRAQLGLPPDYKNPLDIPKELENQQSTVQSAVSEIASSLAQAGIPFDPKDAVQAKAFDDFLRPRGISRPARAWRTSSTRPRRSRWRWPLSHAPASSLITPCCSSDGPRSDPRSPDTSRTARSTRGTASSQGKRCSRSGPPMSGSPLISRKLRSTTSASACPSTSMSTRTRTGSFTGASPASAPARGCLNRCCRPRTPRGTM